MPATPTSETKAVVEVTPKWTTEEALNNLNNDCKGLLVLSTALLLILLGYRAGIVHNKGSTFGLDLFAYYLCNVLIVAICVFWLSHLSSVIYDLSNI
jgi:hypothetical protein